MDRTLKRRFTIPRGILEAFDEQPRFVIDPAPGFWPIDIGILQQTDILKNLAMDKEFIENFEIVIMPK